MGKHERYSWRPVVRLLAHTPEPEKTIAMAARLCYSKSTIEKIEEKLSPDYVKSFLKKLRDMGHESPFEHASFTFGVENVSRAMTHQLVRHRIASYSQQSQRYVSMENFSYVMPPSIEERPEAKKKFQEIMKQIENCYRDLQKIVPKEDARYVLPNATTTRIIFTMNARELFHFFKLRCCMRAQWEIRGVAIEMLRILRRKFPLIFDDVGPPCLHGSCTEGSYSCGRMKDVQDFFRKLR